MPKPRKQRETAEPTAEPKKPYVGDYGAPLEGAGEIVAASFGMVVLALGIGFAIGLSVWAILWLAEAITDLVWHGIGDQVAVWWFPLVVCPIGGLVIGLWTKAFDNAPRTLEEVMAQVKETGSYKVKGLPTSIVSFFLPLAFGGSIGPEAGLTGLIAAGCSWIGDTLKKAGLKAKAVADLTISATLSAIFGTPFAGIVAAAEDVIPNPSGYTFRRSAKIILYSSAAFGAFAGILAFTALFGSSCGLPRFESVSASTAEFIWFVPCIAAAYLLALVYHGATKVTGALSRRMADHVILKPLICGVIIGGIAVFLPNVLFSGQAQSSELMDTWVGMSALVLVLTGVLKAAATPLCVNMGWRGGNFFPSIFAGVSCGYGIAALSGVDPMFCVTVVTTAYLAAVTRKPLLTMSLLILCFPLRGLLWIGLAALAGAAIPLPRILRSRESQ